MERLSRLMASALVLLTGVSVRADDVEPCKETVTAASTSRLPPSGPGGPHERPCRLGVPKAMIPMVDELWASSPTFRGQCVGLARAELTVAIGLSPFLSSRMRATSSILLRDGRAFYASVTLRDDLHVEEELPHELEHVIEQIEGRDFARDAARRRAAWASTPGSFETERALAAGVLARDEVHQARRRARCPTRWRSDTR
jgi:hypothetical protein